MRITGYSDFNLKSIISKNNSKLVDFLNNNSEIKGKIIDAKLNAVKVLLDDGNQLIANSNIPLENLLGEEISFKVLKSDNGIVLQPKIEGTALEKELNLKINNLMSELQIQNTKENKELAKEMIKQNIPVNKENFKFLRENLTAFKLLSNFSQEEIENLYKNTENIENKDIREVVKNIYVNKEGKNLLDFLGNLKNNELKQKDILFLFKNNFKLNIENLKIMDDFLSKDENIEVVLSKINSLFSEDDKILSGVMKFEELDLKNINIEKNNKFKSIEIEDETFDEITDLEKDSDEHLNLKKDIKDIIKSIIKNLEVDKEVNIEKIKQDLNSLLKNIGLEKDISLGKIENKDINEISQKLEFLNKLSNEYMYLQVPFQHKEYKNLAEIILDNKNNKREKNSKSISIFISLNTHNLDRIDSVLNYNEGDLKIVFGSKQSVINMFKLNENKLISTLKKLGLKNVNINYKLKEDNESALSKLEYINNNFSNFNLWV